MRPLDEYLLVHFNFFLTSARVLNGIYIASYSTLSANLCAFWSLLLPQLPSVFLIGGFLHDGPLEAIGRFPEWIFSTGVICERKKRHSWKRFSVLNFQFWVAKLNYSWSFDLVEFLCDAFFSSLFFLNKIILLYLHYNFFVLILF